MASFDLQESVDPQPFQIARGLPNEKAELMMDGGRMADSGCRHVRLFKPTWAFHSVPRQQSRKRAVFRGLQFSVCCSSVRALAAKMGLKMRWCLAPHQRLLSQQHDQLLACAIPLAQTIRNVFGPLTFPNGGLFRICYSPDGIQWQACYGFSSSRVHRAAT